MVAENEVVTLVLGVGVLVFIWGYRRLLKHVPYTQVLILGFCLMLIGWVATIAEEFAFGTLLNHLEHSSYALASLCVLFWCHRALGTQKE